MIIWTHDGHQDENRGDLEQFKALQVCIHFLKQPANLRTPSYHQDLLGGGPSGVSHFVLRALSLKNVVVLTPEDLP